MTNRVDVDGAGASAARPPSGQQVRISLGDQEVWSVAVAAGLRTYTVAGRELLDGYDEATKPDGGRGQTLLPWPNRIAGARYEFDGVEQQLAISEPKTGNAIHGLARWVPWQVAEQTAGSVTWVYVIPPQPGWPTSLECSVTYALAADGLTVTTTASNVGAAPCPYGTASHPYLRAGNGLVDTMSVQVPAATWYETDPAGIPTATHDVAGTQYDLGSLQPVGARVLDTCFGGLARDPDGRWRVRLTDPDAGTGVALWGDDTYGWVQLFSGDTLAPTARRRGVAVEPMTCPPDAFHSGEGVVRLEPGESHTARWGIEPTSR